LLLGHRPSWLTRALCFMPTWVQSNFTASARVQTVSREAAKFAKFLGILFGSVPDSENLSQHPSGSANKRSLVCHSGAQRRSMGREVEESKGRAVEETGRITRYGIILPTRYSMLAANELMQLGSHIGTRSKPISRARRWRRRCCRSRSAFS
jgi:hypothetical protein